MAAGARRRRHPALRVTALLLGIVLMLVAVEIVFRLFCTLPPWFAALQLADMYEATAGGGVALLPGHRGTLTVGDGRNTSVAIDSLGMRGAARAPRVPGERGVLVLGDSLVFGHGVEVDEALPARLDAALRGNGVPAVAGNGGVPGYGMRHAVEHMARLDAAFGADAFVLCANLGDDATDELSDLSIVYAGLRLHGAWARLTRDSWRMRLALRSRAALWLEDWLSTNKPEWSLRTHMTLDPQEAALAAGMPPDGARHAGLFLDVADAKTTWQEGAPAVVPRVLDRLRESLQRAQEIAGKRPLVFVVLPTVWQVDEGKRVERLEQLGFEPRKFDRGLAQQRWLGVARGLGIKGFDATPILTAESDHAGLFLGDGGHFSVRGNEVIARWLASELAPLLR